MKKEKEDDLLQRGGAAPLEILLDLVSSGALMARTVYMKIPLFRAALLAELLKQEQEDTDNAGVLCRVVNPRIASYHAIDYYGKEGVGVSVSFPAPTRGMSIELAFGVGKRHLVLYAEDHSSGVVLSTGGELGLARVECKDGIEWVHFDAYEDEVRYWKLGKDEMLAEDLEEEAD